MTPIEIMVLTGIFMLITAVNLKLAIWYIERKQAKKTLESYNRSQTGKTTQKTLTSFILSEIKCVDNVEKNMNTYLDALTSNEIEKIGIIKDDALVAVMMPIQRYENIRATISKMENIKP